MEWNKTVWESDLEYGLHLLRLGIDTHAITSHFALPLMIKRPGALVVEVNDGTTEYNSTNYRVSFFYDLVKSAVNRMAFSLGHELRPHQGTAVSLTPGWLRSEAMLDAYAVTESNWRDATARQPHFAISESPAFVGRAVAALAGDPDVARWNGMSLSSGQLAKVYGFTDLDGSQPDAWRYLVEVQDAGKPADVRGYRDEPSHGLRDWTERNTLLQTGRSRAVRQLSSTLRLARAAVESRRLLTSSVTRIDPTALP